MNQRVVAIALVLFFYGVGSFISARADTIRYSWSGQLVPNDSSSPDPWMIGPAGKPFDLEVAVSRDASDLSEQSLELSAFAVVHANLLLDGEVVAYIGSGVIDFNDGNPFYDLMSFVGEFGRSGNIAEFSTVVSLPSSTFQFLHPNESLPVFTSTTNATRSTFGNQFYSGIVEQGAAVTVVPEPETITFLIIGLLALTRTCRKKYCLRHMENNEGQLP